MRKSILSIIIFLQAFNPCFAYIDPGSGSMLFSMVLGIISGIIFLLQTLIIKLKLFSFFKKELLKNNIPYVIYSEGKQYYKVFEPILAEFEKRKIPLVYLSSSKDESQYFEKYNYIKYKYIGKGFSACAKLAFLKADICLMTTPNLDVFHLKRSKYVKWYCFIFHGIASLYMIRLFAFDYYDAILCPSSEDFKPLRELELKRNLKKKELISTGSTYFDYTMKKIINPSFKNDKLTILLMSSWGEKGFLKDTMEKLIEELLKNNLEIIVRPHPQSQISEKELIIKLEEKFKGNKNVIFDKGDELDIFNRADILITSYSSVMFDWAFLREKPFIYINKKIQNELYECSQINCGLTSYQAIKDIGYELKEENIQNINNLISMAAEDEKIKEKIKFYKKIFVENAGNSGKIAADYLIQKQKEL